METKQILDTIKMVSDEKLDIRTVTLGVSLLDCIDSNSKISCSKIYDKLTKSAKNLVQISQNIEKEYGIPIINKRLSVTPISLIAAASEEKNYVSYACALDKAAKNVGVDLIGGFSALVPRGYQRGDLNLIKSIPQSLTETNRVCSSVNVGSTKSGINLNAVKQMGQIISQIASQNAKNCTKLVTFANAVEDNPFMAGSFHGIGQADKVINIGISGPGVIKKALEKVKQKPIDEVSETIKKTAFKIARAGQFMGKMISKKLHIPFGIVDLSLAPTPNKGDSVGEILEEIGLKSVGVPGTTATLALLNDAVKKGGIMACKHVGGLSGAFIPISEDSSMIKAVLNHSLNIEKLEAMTSVCSVGIDMVAIPGKTTSLDISSLIADEASIGVFNNKTTAVRIIPVKGKSTGEKINLGGLFGLAPIMAIKENKFNKFIERGGQIPAPINSFKN